MPCFLLGSSGTTACLLSVVIPTHCTHALPGVSATVRMFPVHSTTPCTGVTPCTARSLLEFPPHHPHRLRVGNVLTAQRLPLLLPHHPVIERLSVNGRIPVSKPGTDHREPWAGHPFIQLPDYPLCAKGALGAKAAHRILIDQ